MRLAFPEARDRHALARKKIQEVADENPTPRRASRAELAQPGPRPLAPFLLRVPAPRLNSENLAVHPQRPLERDPLMLEEKLQLVVSSSKEKNSPRKRTGETPSACPAIPSVPQVCIQSIPQRRHMFSLTPPEIQAAYCIGYCGKHKKKS